MCWKAVSSCKEATRLLSRGMDDPLNFWEHIALNIHLKMCLSCLRFRKQTRALRTLLLKYGREAAAESSLPALSTDARMRILHLLRQEGAP